MLAIIATALGVTNDGVLISALRELLAEIRRLQSEVAKWRRDGYVRAAEDRIAALEAGLREACSYIASDVTLDGVSVHDRLHALTSSPPDTQDR